MCCRCINIISSNLVREFKVDILFIHALVPLFLFAARMLRPTKFQPFVVPVAFRGPSYQEADVVCRRCGAEFHADVHGVCCRTHSQVRSLRAASTDIIRQLVVGRATLTSLWPRCRGGGAGAQSIAQYDASAIAGNGHATTCHLLHVGAELGAFLWTFALPITF